MRNERQLRKILWINSMGGRIWCFSSCRSVASSLRKKVFHSIFFRLLVTGLQLVFQAYKCLLIKQQTLDVTVTIMYFNMYII